MIPYNEKLFQTPATKMTTEWCGPFVPMPKLEEVVQGALRNDARDFGYNATFLYPRRGGIQALPTALAKQVPPIETGTEVDRVDWNNKTVTFSDRRTVSYKILVNTMPLSELLDKMNHLPGPVRRARVHLRYASILCLNIGVRRPRISDKSWIYFPEDKFPFYRVGFPMNFSPHVAPRNCSSMYVEIPFNRIQGKSKADILKMTKKGLVDCGILRKSDNCPVVQFLPIKHAYVVYDQHRSKALRIINSFLHRHGILSIGRYGGWKYSFMEEAVRDGMEAAQKIKTLVRGRA
jgi:protoporphyrinogen oxidase